MFLFVIYSDYSGQPHYVPLQAQKSLNQRTIYDVNPIPTLNAMQKDWFPLFIVSGMTRPGFDPRPSALETKPSPQG